MELIHKEKVMLNLGNFIGRNLSINFLKFINGNADKIFVAEVCKSGGYKRMYTLKEDTSNPQWLFFEDDLIFLDEIED
jgi:hypothetical protein